MKIIVNPHKLEIVRNPVNEKEINITKCEFEFADEITDDFVKKAYFTYKGTSYEVLIENNECNIPQEVLEEIGEVEIGVVAYLLDNEEYVKRYNPSPAYFNSWIGSLKGETENTEPITPTDKEQIEQALQEMETKVDNLDIEASKVGDTTTITITRKDGTQETTEIEDGIDGVGLNYNWNGTSLGVKREDEQTYNYVNLKGDKGDPGAIKMIIVNVLPATGEEDTIYLVPIQGEQGNNYEEYIYVNNAWEKLGGIQVEVDLTDYYTKEEANNLLDGKADVEDIPDLTGYVKNTDYASTNVAGVFKLSNNYGTSITSGGFLRGMTKSYQQYLDGEVLMLISKVTLENVIAGKELVNKTYVDGLVGDINTALDLLNGEVI